MSILYGWNAKADRAIISKKYSFINSGFWGAAMIKFMIFSLSSWRHVDSKLPTDDDDDEKLAE
jgi:hypothetical protein